MTTHVIDAALVAQLKSKLSAQGFSVYELNTTGVQDRISFFKAAMAGLPMGDATRRPDVTWSFPQNWAAFGDFLWQGLTEQGAPVAIVWTGSAELHDSNPELYGEAIDAITAAAESDDDGNTSSPILFLTGPNFASSVLT